MGYPFIIVEPSTFDLIRTLKRTTQIMFPKDIGFVLLKLNVVSGSRIVEAGTGSGGLTLALARAVGDIGRVYSYEVRPEIHPRVLVRALFAVLENVMVPEVLIQGEFTPAEAMNTLFTLLAHGMFKAGGAASSMED